jgi:ribosome-binding factor A
MSRRTDRVSELLRQELSELLVRSVKDPRVEHGLVSVTAVEVSPDLRYATVYVSHLGNEEERAEVLAGLEHAASYLHNELVRRLSLKHVPRLRFRFDPSIERGARLSVLIRQVAPKDAEPEHDA